MATKSFLTNKPYVLDILPHYRNPFPSAQESLAIFLDRWSFDLKSNIIVADAAFGSITMMETIKEKVDIMGFWGTLSMSEISNSWLWPLLKRNTSENNWKACQNDSFLFSIINSEQEGESETSRRYQKIITNAFLSKSIQKQKNLANNDNNIDNNSVDKINGASSDECLETEKCECENCQKLKQLETKTKRRGTRRTRRASRTF